MGNQPTARLCLLVAIAIASLNTAVLATAQQAEIPLPAPSSFIEPRLAEPIDNLSTVALPGHLRTNLTPNRDLGPVEDSLPLRLMLVLKRSPQQQARLDNLIARQQEPTAPEYHRWLTPKEFGQNFGLADQDISKISAWLRSRGFEVHSILNNKAMIDFEGTAATARNAFQTDLHYWNINGTSVVANATPPRIPIALAAVVKGIYGLDQTPPNSSRIPTIRPQPAFDYSSQNHFVTPQDFYKIYQVNPIFAAGNLGSGATIAVIEPGEMNYGTVNASTGAATGGDVAQFRKVFGVPGTLNMTVLHGAGTVTCAAGPANPPVDAEESLDAEWASALAPSAHLIYMSCSGDFIRAATALIDNNLADTMSSSFLFPENTGYYPIDQVLAQAATQGQTFINAAGDTGSEEGAPLGIAVPADNPLALAVGGTDFQDLYDANLGGLPLSHYWSTTNSATYESALSYVPETVWNSSCASSIMANYFGAGQSPAAFCAQETSLSGAGGAGGISVEYAQPTYQLGITGLSSSVTQRAIPDVSFFAAGNGWGHALVSCDTPGGAPCTSTATFSYGGGTSYAAPQMAGITALLVAHTGERQGLLQPALYSLAKAQYTAAATRSACYANGQTNNIGVTKSLPASTCIFNDVTTSNNSQPCQAGTSNCYVNPGAAYGVLSTTTQPLNIAYQAGAGYDIATGLGSVNAANLLAQWNTALLSTATLTVAPASITATQSTVLTANVTGGVPPGSITIPPALTGSVLFKAGTATLGTCTLAASITPTATCSLAVAASKLLGGANLISATYLGSATYPASTSKIATVTVTGVASTKTATTTTVSLSPNTNLSVGETLTVTVTVKAASGAAPTGSVIFNSPSAGLSATAALASNGTMTMPLALQSPGTYTFNATYSGSTTDAASTSATITIVVAN